MCRVVAKLNGKAVEMKVVDDETRATKEYKAINPTNKFPLLETSEGNISESMTIAKFLASGSATLLGTSLVERAQVDQWTTWTIAGTYQKGYPAIMGITGRTPVEQDEFKKSVDALKSMMRTLDANLSGDWLVGNQVTVADIAIAAITAPAFQMVLDAGFKKAAPKACAWFARVAALPEFVSVFGRIKQCAKSLKPVIKAKEEPKKKAAPQAAAAKKADEGEKKKDVNPLDALPPSPWNFYDFKTLYVNHPDKRGGGMQALKEQFDPEGYAFWYLHYDKFGSEGTVYYKFENLMRGFMQRFDLPNFRKHAFGKVNMIGEEPSLDIKAVFCFRGTTLPQEASDHPSWEYMQCRKMDLNDPTDFDLIAQNMGANDKDETCTCEGRKLQLSVWYK